MERVVNQSRSRDEVCSAQIRRARSHSGCCTAARSTIRVRSSAGGGNYFAQADGKDASVLNGVSVIEDTTSTPLSLDLGASIELGGWFGCALEETEGALSCWGRNVERQINDDNEVAAPARVIEDGIDQIALGDSVACVLDASDKELRCRGLVSGVRLGRAGSSTWAVVEPPTGSTWSHIVYGSDNGCGVASEPNKDAATRRLYCWGVGVTHWDGESPENAQRPRLIGEVSALRDFAIGGEHMCGITDDQAVECWGQGRDAGDARRWEQDQQVLQRSGPRRLL